MSFFSNGLKVLNTSEEIGRLHCDRRKIFHVIKVSEIGHTVFKIAKFDDFVTGRLKIGMDHTTIKGVNQT